MKNWHSEYWNVKTKPEYKSFMKKMKPVFKFSDLWVFKQEVAKHKTVEIEHFEIELFVSSLQNT